MPTAEQRKALRYIYDHPGKNHKHLYPTLYPILFKGLVTWTLGHAFLTDEGKALFEGEAV